MNTASGKVFGVGLPRTATTSLAAATLELGYKTCHCCFDDWLYDIADAFFDTPIFVDYPVLDRLYPGSRFILTWRPPELWLPSFSRSLLSCFHKIQSPEWRKQGISRMVNWRCYSTVFGMPDTLTEDSLLTSYHAHRSRVEDYFRDRPNDLLILEMAPGRDHWDALCGFLDKPRPGKPFPTTNAGLVREWKDLPHPNKVPSWRIKKPPQVDTGASA